MSVTLIPSDILGEELFSCQFLVALSYLIEHQEIKQVMLILMIVAKFSQATLMSSWHKQSRLLTIFVIYVLAFMSI